MRLDAVPEGAGPLSAMWNGLEGQMEVGLYHSWVVDDEHLPELERERPQQCGCPWRFSMRPFPLQAFNFTPSPS